MDRPVICSFLYWTDNLSKSSTGNLVRARRNGSEVLRRSSNRSTGILVCSSKQRDLTAVRRSAFARGLFEMSRPINLVPAFLLSFAGSWMTANYSPRVLLMPAVWTSSACSALILAASMLVNDCYDHISGTDGLNRRNSALLSGEITTADVGLVAGCIYGGVMLATCCLEQPIMRLLITLSAYITFVYTPLVKKVTLLKNIVVSGVIASAIFAGGLAVTHGSVSVIPQRTLASSFYLFLSILGREILMDVKDMAGDRVTGVRTIPVCFGEQTGTCVAVLCATAANLFLIQMAWLRRKSWYVSLVLSIINSGMLACFISKLPTFSRDELSQDYMLVMALGTITMATSL